MVALVGGNIAGFVIAQIHKEIETTGPIPRVVILGIDMPAVTVVVVPTMSPVDMELWVEVPAIGIIIVPAIGAVHVPDMEIEREIEIGVTIPATMIPVMPAAMIAVIPAAMIVSTIPAMVARPVVVAVPLIPVGNLCIPRPVSVLLERSPGTPVGSAPRVAAPGTG